MRLYAQAREAVGRSGLRREVPASGATVQSVLDSLVADHPALQGVLGTCRVAVNGAYIDGREIRLRAGDELSVHPPYSGG